MAENLYFWDFALFTSYFIYLFIYTALQLKTFRVVGKIQ